MCHVTGVQPVNTRSQRTSNGVQSCDPLYDTWTRSKIHVSNLELTWIFDKVFDDFSTMVTQTNEEALIYNLHDIPSYL